jgi:hypothetical protein
MPLNLGYFSETQQMFIARCRAWIIKRNYVIFNHGGVPLSFVDFAILTIENTAYLDKQLIT